MSRVTARQCLLEAKESTEDGDLTRAFDLYLKAFNIFPRLKSAYKIKFLTVFTQYLHYQEDKGDRDTIFNAYKEALTVFPGESVILSEVGKYLLRHKHYLEAWYQFQAILKEDSSSVNADYFLNEVKVSLVPRWHYRMLNDKTRNFSYHAAIREVVQAGTDTVLDVGTGSGLLAMYAAKCNPESVTGIEMVGVLSSMAQHLTVDNNFHSIRVITEPSQSLSEADIGGKKSLLITEVFDVGLFGEGIIPTLDHAYKNLLQDNARVVPIGAEFFIRGIKCDSLKPKYYLNNITKALLSIPLDEIVSIANDSYDSADVSLYEDVQYMTEPQSVVKVDFTNPAELESKLSRVEEYTIQLKPSMNGEVSTIIGWFDLHLTNQIFLTTNPTSENRSPAWQQVVFNDFLPKEVQEGIPFTVTMKLSNGLHLSLKPDTECNVKISENLMKFLNDELYVENMTNCADMSFMHLLRTSPLSEIVVADLSLFPIFGLIMLKGGVQFLYCYSKNKVDQDFFRYVFQANGINNDRYTIIDNEENFLGDKKFHAIYYNIFDPNGNIDRTMLRITHHMEINNLIEGGLFVPYNIRVMGQLIYSPILDVHNRVYDENTGYMIAHHMNKFQVSVNYGLDLTHLKYTEYSDPINLGYCRSMKPQIIECPIKREGAVNGILCWYEIKVSQYSESVTTKRPKSFMYSMAFLADPHVHVEFGDIPDVICCVDDDQTFKLIADNVDDTNECH